MNIVHTHTCLYLLREICWWVEMVWMDCVDIIVISQEFTHQNYTHIHTLHLISFTHNVAPHVIHSFSKFLFLLAPFLSLKLSLSLSLFLSYVFSIIVIVSMAAHYSPSIIIIVAIHLDHTSIYVNGCIVIRNLAVVWGGLFVISIVLFCCGKAKWLSLSLVMDRFGCHGEPSHWSSYW